MFQRLTILLLLFSGNVVASESLSYSGRLVNTNGSPVSGPVNLKFDFAYTNAPSSILCTKQISPVALTNGVFHVKLDPDCTPSSWLNVLSAVPSGEALAIRVTDETHTKTYSFQALHSMPLSTISQMAKQLAPLGATSAGQVLKWNGSAWEAGNETGTGSGSVTSVATGTGLSGGPITNSGTISIANGGVDTIQLADGAVTDQKIAGSIARTKLANGSASHVLVNDGSGVISSVAQLPVAQGGTGASSAAGARTNLGLGTAAVVDLGTGVGRAMPSDAVPVCFAFEKLQMTPGPAFAWACVADNDSADNTKLPLDGSVAMTGSLDMDNHLILDVATPTANGHAANKLYVDSVAGAINGSQWTTNGTAIHYVSGNVGIGTTDPVAKFQVNVGTNQNVAITSLNSEPRISALNDAGNANVNLKYQAIDHRFFNANGTSEVFTIKNSGNIGVGTTNPGEKLDVSGNIALTGKMRLKSDNANYVELQAPSGLISTLNFKLPGTVGAAGNALVTDGAGNLSWSTVATGATGVGGDLTGTITNAQIAAGTIVNADISATAAIAQSKIANLSADLAAKEPAIAAGTTSQYWSGDKSWQTLNTTAVSEGTRLYFTEPRVLETDLAGFVSGAGVISSSDSVLSAIGKLDGNISALSSAAATSFVNVSGDTMTGDLILNADPTNVLGAATKQYVDSQITGSSYWTKTVNNLSYSNGYVGIGTSTPTSPLDIRTEVTAPLALTRYSDTAVQGTGVIYNRARGTVALPTAVQNGDKLSTMANVFGYDGDSYVTAAGINIAVDGTPGDGDMPGRMEFIVQGDDQGQIIDNITPAMVIRSTGNVGIGTTSPFGALHVGTNSATSSSFIIDTSKVNQGSMRITSDASANYIQSGVDVTSGSAKDLRFGPYLNSTPWMSISAAGNLGIGTTGPGEKLDVVGNIALTGKLRMKSDNANFVEFRAPPSLASTQTLTWPGTSGAAGNALTTDGAGNLSWAAIATTTTSVGGDLTGTISNAQIAAGAIVNADVSATAAIAQSKIANLTTDLAAKQPLISAGTTSQYWRGDKSWQTLNTTAVAEGTNLYFLDSRVRSALMSGYAVGSALPLAATDTLIEALGKLEAQIIANDTAFDNSGIWNKSGANISYSAGNVGIGTNLPGQPLTVLAPGSSIPNSATWINTSGNPTMGFYSDSSLSGSMDFLMAGATNTPSTRPVLIGRRSRGTLATPEALVTGDTIFSFLGSGYDGTNFHNPGSIDFMVNGVVSSGVIPTDISFKTGSSTRTEKLRITSDGNVGIGTANPTLGMSFNPTNRLLTVEANGVSGPTLSGGLILGNGGAMADGYELGHINFVGRQNGLDLDGNMARITARASGSGGVDGLGGTLQFFTKGDNVNGSAVERMRISPQGNVGIGTINPTAKLTVFNDGGTGASDDVRVISYNSADEPALLFYSANGTSAAPLASTASNAIGLFKFHGHTGAVSRSAAEISIVAENDWTTTTSTQNSAMRFATIGAGTYSEAMRISSAGNIGIGTTNPQGKMHIASSGDAQIILEADTDNANEDDMPLLKMSLDGGSVGVNIGFNDGAFNAGNTFRIGRNYGGVEYWDTFVINLANSRIGIGTQAPAYPLDVVGDINSSGSVRAAGVALTSDKRFKKEIKPLTDSLNRILSLRGVNYNWKTEEYPERNFVERTQIGVIAQEVEKVFPELVDTDTNGFKSVNYPALIAPLIESTRTLKMESDKKGREIASLKEQTDRLTKENADMRARLERLEKALLKR